MSQERHTGRGRGKRTRQAVIAEGAGFLPDLREVLARYHKRTSPAHRRLVLFILLAALALRVVMLLQPITAQEAFLGVHDAMRPVSEIVSDMGQVRNHVLHTLLVKASLSMFGVDLVALRIPAFLAAIFSLPLFYLFVRALFNRYIAVMALALVAGSGGLIEYSAVASGHSLVWAFTMLALVLGRHYLQTNNPVSAVGVGGSLALSMWSAPSGLYAVVMVWSWTLVTLQLRYRDTFQARMRVWFIGFGVFLLATLLLFAPVIHQYGLGHIVHHTSLPDHSWRAFKRIHTEGTLLLWFHIVETSAAWFAVLGGIGLLVAAYISGKYRTLAMSMLFGAIVPVLLIRYVPGPEHWYFTLYILHVSTALVLFYLLKFVQEKLVPGLGKRTRVAVTAVVLLAATGWASVSVLLTSDRLQRFPEVADVAHHLDQAMSTQDRVLADGPWEDPLLFALMEHGWAKGAMDVPEAEGSTVYLLVDPGGGQTVATVLATHHLSAEGVANIQELTGTGRVKVYAGRVKGTIPGNGPVIVE